MTGLWQAVESDGQLHQIEYGEFARAGGRRGLRAKCACGWVSPRVVESESQMWADGKAHVRGVAVRLAQSPDGNSANLCAPTPAKPREPEAVPQELPLD